MAERPVILTVEQPGTCVLAPGQKILFHGKEVSSPGGGKLCAQAVCTLYPQLHAMLTDLAPDAPLPTERMICGCGTVFRAAFAQTGRDAPAASRYARSGSTASHALKQTSPFLKRLPLELGDELRHFCARKRCTAGDVLLEQGVTGQHLYIVADGSVEVVRRKDNAETVLAALGPGECFGEMSILTGEVTSAEVRAVGACAVLLLPKADLESLLLKRPVLSAAFSKLLAERLKAASASMASELSRGIVGKLSLICLSDMVQMLNQSRQSGTMVLTQAGEQARLGFRNGALTDAQCGAHAGDEAFFHVLGWPDGEFSFERGDLPAEAPAASAVTLDTMGLIMEGLRRLDEQRAASA